VNTLASLTAARSRLFVALVVALVVAFAPHAANAQPILRAKAQQATPAAAPTLWQTVASQFAGAGQQLVPDWSGVAAQLAQPALTFEQAQAVEQIAPLPLVPWLTLP